MKIDRLELLASDIPALHNFYTGVFGLPLLGGDGALSIMAGRSELTFLQAPQDWSGFYHFAFNIPQDQFEEAKEWLSKRVMPIKDDKGNDEFTSKEWNAHSVYFYDPAGNILEFIARHDLDEHLDRPFDEQSILSISEIGLATDDVQAMVRSLQAEMGINPYGGAGSDAFAAVGDEHGLFIVVKRGRIWFPDTGKEATAARLRVEVSTAAQASYILSGPPYEINRAVDGP